MNNDDPIDEDELNLGACCACEGIEDVYNIIMLDYKARVPGTGWGCVICGLGMNGALAVICNECLENEKPIIYAVDGFPVLGQRILLSELVQGYGHDLFLHGAAHAHEN